MEHGRTLNKDLRNFTFPEHSKPLLLYIYSWKTLRVNREEHCNFTEIEERN